MKTNLIPSGIGHFNTNLPNHNQPNADHSEIINRPLTVSVIICAYTEERWDDLLAAVASVEEQTQPAQEIVVVIDHNPTLFARAQAQLTNVMVIENTQPQGLSGARNSGIAAAQSEIIAFLDDDATAAPNWLAWLCHWLRDPKVMGAGGVVEPIWEGGQPAWFPVEFNWVIGCSYRGLPRHPQTIRNLFGGCMCIRREVFEAVGGFRIGIGRSDSRPLGCEETELCIRANQQWPDHQFLYEPRAWAYHRVPAKRSKWRYFRERCYAEGLSKALVSQTVGAKDGLAAERTYTMITLPLGVFRNLGDLILHSDVDGMARAGAIIGGLAFTVAGYLFGRITQRPIQPQILPSSMTILKQEKRVA
ncbi:MAG: glycosyltransferase [Caldilineaceae bacterium]